MLSSRLEEAVQGGWLEQAQAQQAIALCRAFAEHDERLQVIVAVVLAWIDLGHTCLDLTDFSPSQLAVHGDVLASATWWPNAEAIEQCLRESSLVGPWSAQRAFVWENERWLAPTRWFRNERIVAQELDRRARSRGFETDPQALATALLLAFDEVWQTQGFRDRQVLAAGVAALRPLTLLTGGPGTGKTTTVAKILAVLAQLGQSTAKVVLAAPTGKAAARMIESIQALIATMPAAVQSHLSLPTQAQTLHRLLGLHDAWRPRARFDASNPLQLDVLVVDEASMIDVEMMARLLVALPAHARLILVGDPLQLPSVDPGAVLADLCRQSFTDPSVEWGADLPLPVAEVLAKAATFADVPLPLTSLSGQSLSQPMALQASRVSLTKARRYAESSGIGALAQALVTGSGGFAAVAEVLRRGWSDVEWLSHGEDDPRIFATWIERMARGFRTALAGSEAMAWIHRGQRQFRVLSALRKGPCGVETLNAKLAQAALRGRQRVVTPILVTENDYEANLFNGDLGVCESQGTNHAGTMAWFASEQGQVRRMPQARLPAHELAYALTVHKSQGSEFDEVWLVLDARAARVANVELLFTAVTRARRKLVVCATPQTLAAVVARRADRQTGLPRRLAEFAATAAGE